MRMHKKEPNCQQDEEKIRESQGETEKRQNHKPKKAMEKLPLKKYIYDCNKYNINQNLCFLKWHFTSANQVNYSKQPTYLIQYVDILKSEMYWQT